MRMGVGGRGLEVLGAEAGRPGPLVTGAPYSADVVSQITETLPDGNTIRQTSTTRIYRDSQGRTRREPALNALGNAVPGGSLPQLAFINDPVAGVSYALDLTNHAATRTPLSPGAGQARPNRVPRQRPDAANVRSESLGRQVISGVPADGTRTTLTIPAGQIGNAQPIQVVTESWYSADLQLTLLSRRSDPRSGETVVQLSNLSRAEPSSMLFVVPGDFQIAEQPRGMRRNRGAAPAQ